MAAASPAAAGTPTLCKVVLDVVNGLGFRHIQECTDSSNTHVIKANHSAENDAIAR